MTCRHILHMSWDIKPPQEGGTALTILESFKAVALTSRITGPAVVSRDCPSFRFSWQIVCMPWITNGIKFFSSPLNNPMRSCITSWVNLPVAPIVLLVWF
jgi:hypothetical protein